MEPLLRAKGADSETIGGVKRGFEAEFRAENARKKGHLAPNFTHPPKLID